MIIKRRLSIRISAFLYKNASRSVAAFVNIRMARRAWHPLFVCVYAGMLKAVAFQPSSMALSPCFLVSDLINDNMELSTKKSMRRAGGKEVERGEKIVKAYLIEPFREKEYSYIGMEFEYPVISLGQKVSLREIGSAFLKELVEKQGYQEEIRGTDGYLVRVSRDGDSVSFDCSYNLFEISMGKQKNIYTLQERMIPVLRQAQEFYQRYDCMLPGMGARPVPNKSLEYTCDPFYTMIREFTTDCTGEKEPGKYFANMCSVQTHIDVPYADLLDTYNLFNRLDFVRGMLFANSLGTGEDDEPVYCMRDLIWERCGIPNTGIYDEQFSSLDEIAAAISRERIFVRADGGKLLWMAPEKLSAYFQDERVPEENIQFFRSFKRVVLNSYHVLEIRGDCTQPVKHSFVTAAFHVGIAYNYRKAAAALEQFLTDNRINASNSELRRMAVRGKAIAGEKETKAFLNRLLDIAAEGLTARGFNEEMLLTPLRERALQLTNPAKELQGALEAGISIEDMIRQYA